MKKLFAASLLSISLCVSQTGSAWASAQTHFPPPVSSEGVDVGAQNLIVEGVIVILIAEIILYFLLPALDKTLSGNDEEDMGKVCDFYEEYRENYDIWNHDYMKDLGDKIWDSKECGYLFDVHGNDFDEKGQCYIWEPQWGDEGYGLCSNP